MEQTTVRTTEGDVVCERCSIARTSLTRAKGLLGRDELLPGQGILLRPAGSIHTAFMRFPIDAVFLDREFRVVRIARDLGPWRMAAARGARTVLELRAGEAARRRLEVGARLELSPQLRSLALETQGGIS